MADEKWEEVGPSIGNEIPSGGIIIWSGAIANIPAGWFLCDGTNGTPDLTDRFVIHADADAAGTNNVGATGGASTVTLTAAQSGLPSHTHTVVASLNGAGGAGTNPQTYTSQSTASSFTTDATGGSAASESHSNRDKFYALAYIMKS